MANNNAISALNRIENILDEYSAVIQNQTDRNLADLFKSLKSVINSNNALVLKTINDLLGLNYLVDTYQRGYKWQDLQVEALLNDINDFDSSKSEFYCLQPVVVKYHAAENPQERGIWELIDGQQRVTTIFIILKYLTNSNSYSINYKTRESSAEFLDIHLLDSLNFKEWTDFIKAEENHKYNNVDNYHFYKAIHCVARWFEGKSSDEKEEWKSKLLEKTKIIWYAAPEAEQSIDNKASIDIFMRINSGKIPLTNAELIKALFLLNFNDSENDEVKRIQQIEMAQQWDAIEYQLQDDEFWYFLHGDSKTYSGATRIEILFDLLSDRAINRIGVGEFYTFIYYSELFENADNSRDAISAEWENIKNCFYRIYEWYKNDNLYHLVGFILTRGLGDLRTLWKLSVGINKSEFVVELKIHIGSKLRSYFHSFDGTLELDNLSYGGNKDSNKRIENILVLFNIHEHQSIKTKLSFKDYAKKIWSLEHIHAQHSKDLLESQKWDSYYHQHKALLASELYAEPLAIGLSAKLDLWYNSVKSEGEEIEVNQFNEYLVDYQDALDEIFGEMPDEDMHVISNLALLQRSDNSSLNNEVFSVKRTRIIERDRHGSFIPLATKKVFSKYYSDKVAHMHLWSQEDRLAYRVRILSCLRQFPGLQELE